MINVLSESRQKESMLSRIAEYVSSSIHSAKIVATVAVGSVLSLAATDASPSLLAQEATGKKDAGAETKKIPEEPVEHLVTKLSNAYVKGVNVDGAFAALEKRGVSGVRALLRYSSTIRRLDFRIRVDQWVAERAKSDSAVLQFLVDSLSRDDLGADAARVLPRVGSSVPELILNALYDSLDPERRGPAMDAAEKKRLIERAKHVLCLLPAACTVVPVSQRFQRESAAFRESREPTTFAVDMAYILCTRSEGVTELTGIVKKRPTDQTGKSILRGMKLVLDEAGDDLLSLNEGGNVVKNHWYGLFAAFDAEPRWKALTAPLEKQFETIVQNRHKRLEELRKKASEKKSSYLRPRSPNSFAYAAIIESRESTRSVVARPFSERRTRSDSSIDRRMASLRARSESATHRMAS